MYKTLEEADKAAREAQWTSIHFDKERDLPVVAFEERMEMCKSCDKLTPINICSECLCFMPIKTRLRSSECPLKKWVSIGVDPMDSPPTE